MPTRSSLHAFTLFASFIGAPPRSPYDETRTHHTHADIAANLPERIPRAPRPSPHRAMAEVGQ